MQPSRTLSCLSVLGSSLLLGCATGAPAAAPQPDWTVAPAPTKQTRSGGLPSYYSEAAPATVEMPFATNSGARRAAGVLVHSDGWVVASLKSVEGVEPSADMHLEIELRVGHLEDNGVMRRGPVRIAKVHKLSPNLGLALLRLVQDEATLPEPIALSASGPSVGQDVRCITHGDQLWETYPGQVLSVSESITSSALTVLVDCGDSYQRSPRLGTVLVSAAGEVLALQGWPAKASQDSKLVMAHVDDLRAFLQDAPDEPLMVMPDSLGPGTR